MFNNARMVSLSKQCLKWLWCLWLIYLPINLFWKFGIDSAYVNGRLVDYLVPKIYVTDLIMLGVICIGLVILGIQTNQKRFLPKLTLNFDWLIVLGFFLLIGLFQFWAVHPVVAVMTFIRLVTICLFGLAIYWQKNLLKSLLLPGLVLTLVMQVSLGLFQFVRQIPLAEYPWLGESRITGVTSIAKFEWRGQERTLAYGSTAHPNIFAGVILVFGLLIWELSGHTKLKLGKLTIPKNGIKGVALTAVLLTLVMTQSWSAGLGLVFVSIWKILENKKVLINKQLSLSLIILVILFTPVAIDWLSSSQSADSFVRRDYLNRSSFLVWQDHPIWGVGLGNITAQIEKPAINKEVVRFVQPPHHAGLVWLSETGLIGLFLLYLVIKLLAKTHRNEPIPSYFIALLPIIVLDHYLLTTQTGLLLLLLGIIYSSFNQKQA